ncbi:MULTISPECIES: sensor histidine kinase KdpD [unclassified Shinella]|uniref:sensor histidine kinase n=1 Tax=unclassified Shinella TaxID=2643062 RepID=UPI00225CE90E|nr:MULTISPECIES: sensor histidine kinase KdpD [unclassified Shinella]MCO5140657.1 sensor histidine kinase KdpD [Shinella sp.]MDC7256653.1 sensor histidine kinase KdpD [Shinella sp. YE25]CAI0339530.1 Osmosensitive K+ channel histidine kinase KdpD [Rhizobiaceae bacterium]CAK7257928.1 two-component system, OmpR family, sensor histidine kinase KdpD [Shinella sp. WSC3-e]
MADDDSRRPDPDTLLALAEKDRRGKLTVFLGAAPGVGKTYAMLSRAGRLKAEGVDVVVGLVETHGRGETAALLDGLEVLPRRQITHRGRGLEEFDLDGALARRPRIVLVDELAHSNPEGSRHPKRYQDIEELIAAGIDVWTALNIQHLESLADLVAQITGVTVRERVPDVVLKKADEILLVDLPPTELIERLKEGKVYLPDSASRAIDRFFRLGNLTALRELALRRAADRVDDQMVDYLKQHAIEGPWATGERLLVCVGPDDLSEKVVRVASRLASGLNAPWIVVSIERADREVGTTEHLHRIEALFRLAEQLGAETRRVVGNDFVEEILKLARREHATQIVIGARRDRGWRRFVSPSLPDALSRKAAGLGVYFVTPDRKERAPVPARLALPAIASFRQSALIAGAFVVATAAVGKLVYLFAELPNISLLFLLAVLGAAVLGGYASAFIAAFLSALAYNFLFIDPLHTFTITAPHEVFALIVFLSVAIIAGGFASRIKEQAEVARVRATALQSLYDFSRKLSTTGKADDANWVAVSHLQASLKRNIVLLLPEKNDLKVAAVWPPDTELDVTDFTAARWTCDKQEKAGFGTGTLPNSRFEFRPLMGPHGLVGVCGIQQGEERLDLNAERALSAILDQTAIALDRARLSEESVMQAAKLEGERYREALLSSISHDLRTPLATIMGAVTSLRQLGERMTAESRDDLLQSIEEEGSRMSRFVSNLLDMTRIESGTLKPKGDWVDVSDVVQSAVERARKYFPGKTIETGIAADLPLIEGDSVLLGQVLFNLLDNAVKYGGGEPVNVYARRDGQDVLISVTDLGRGIPPAEIDRVFEKFYRRGRPDGRAPGTGLGLSIARGFVEAMGGRIHAESPAVKKKGTRIVIRFPAGEKARTGKAT